MDLPSFIDLGLETIELYTSPALMKVSQRHICREFAILYSLALSGLQMAVRQLVWIRGCAIFIDRVRA